MNNSELKLKLSANSFDIKHLEIKDGKLELVLTAQIDETEFADTCIDESAGNVQDDPDIANADYELDSPSSPEPVVDNEVEDVEIVSEPDERYGEPQPDVEWQAVNDEESVILEEESISPSESTDESAGGSESEPAIQEISLDDDDVSERTKFVNTADYSSAKAKTESKTDNGDDELPDYLRIAKKPERIKNLSGETQNDSEVPEDDKPTVTFERTLPEKDNETDIEPEYEADNELEDNEMIQQESENEQEDTDNTEVEDKPKMVKFLCPRCQTPGLQSIESIGNIITCVNCGRALKLNIKQ